MEGVVWAVVGAAVCAAVMLLIGISNIKSSKPVGFFSSEPGPDPESLTDVAAWNREHGRIWIVYAIVLVVMGIVCIFINNGLVLVAVITVGFLGPVPLMIRRHLRLKTKYLK